MLPDIRRESHSPSFESLFSSSSPSSSPSSPSSPSSSDFIKTFNSKRMENFDEIVDHLSQNYNKIDCSGNLRSLTKDYTPTMSCKMTLKGKEIDIIRSKRHNEDIEHLYLKFQDTFTKPGISPHFPIIYNRGVNDYPLENNNPNNHYIFVEKADIDLANFNVAVECEEIQRRSIFLQCIFALLTINSVGEMHGDTNSGNFLIKKLDTQEGYFQYNFNSKKFYVKHYGYCVYLWDYMLSNYSYRIEYVRFLNRNEFMTAFIKRKDMGEKTINPKGNVVGDMYLFSSLIGTIVTEKVKDQRLKHEDIINNYKIIVDNLYDLLSKMFDDDKLAFLLSIVSIDEPSWK